MNEKQRKFLKDNKEVLREIYSERLNAVLARARDAKGEERDRIMDLFFTLQEEYEMIGLMGEGGGNEPISFI